MLAFILALYTALYSPQDVALCQSVQAPRDAYGAHAIGCDDRLGIYLPDEGRCAAIARSYAMHTTNVVQRTSSHNCQVLEDGTYDDLEG
jgi:hypothetical protein